MRISAVPDRCERFAEIRDRDIAAELDREDGLEIEDDPTFAGVILPNILTTEDVDGPGRGGD